MLNSALVTAGKVYALSQHYFPNEYTVNGNPPAFGVSAVSSNLNTLILAAAQKGVKVFVGDYAHSIPSSNATTAQKDFAMQWQAANMEADFLLMLSQKGSIERANFWAYGLPYAVWHPIRVNADNSYTLMPAAKIYKILAPTFLDKSVAVTTTSSGGSDNNPYAVRFNAFVTNDLDYLNIVAVNRDKNNIVSFQPSVLNAYHVLQARLLTATSVDSDNIIESITTDDGSGNYIMPPLSVLIIEYTQSTCPLTSGIRKAYVDASIPISGSGVSWSTAYKSMDEGIYISWQCPNLNQIEVAQGTYIPATFPYDMTADKRGTIVSSNDLRDVSFHLRPGIELYGGFPSGGGNRNINIYPTILSGNLGNNNNAYHVGLLDYNSFWGDVNDITILDGFIIQGGVANGTGTVLVNSHAISRQYGGGIYQHTVRSALSNNTIQSNQASNGGGIIFEYANVLLNNNFIMNNLATNGNGIYALQSICDLAANNIVYGLHFIDGNCTFSSSNIVRE